MTMKITLFISFILLMNFRAAAQPEAESMRLRDQILKTYQSTTTYKDKINYMRSMYYANVYKDWSVQLLDSVLAVAVANKDVNAELEIYADYYWYYKFQENLPQVERHFVMLREACRKYDSYNNYFLIWSDMLQFYTMRGDTEYARMQSLKMEKEAKRLNNSKGIAYSQMAMAKSLAVSKKEKEAVDLFRKALLSNALEATTQAIIYTEIATIFQDAKRYEEAIEELKKQQTVLKQDTSKSCRDIAFYNKNWLTLELSFCALYGSMSDSKNLLKYLIEAQKYYTPDCFFSDYILYHAYWGEYYRLTRQWDQSIREFDIALHRFSNTQPLYKLVIERLKGNALITAGRHEEAARLYRNIAVVGDSLNKDVIKLHKEALQSNYNIHKALLEKQSLEKQYNWAIFMLVLLLIVLTLIMVYRSLKMRRILSGAEEETRKALETVDSANKMKEVFLRNITQQIREPLNIVINLSKLFAAEKEIDPQLIKEYSDSIKENSGLLFQIIMDVLDLSRLESGMMRFNIAECDVVQICQDAKMAIEIQEENKTELSFETNVESLIVATDGALFLKMLLSILSAPKESDGMVAVKLALVGGKSQFSITVENSPLLQKTENQQRIKHDINRIFLNTFNGSYLLPSAESDESRIVVLYPLA